MEELTEDQLKNYVSQMKAIDPEMANSCVYYIYTQINANSRLGAVNDFEFRKLFMPADIGLIRLVFINHYDKDLMTKKPMYFAAKALMYLLFTRVRGGGDRLLELARIEASRPVQVNR